MNKRHIGFDLPLPENMETWLMALPAEEQIQRVMARDGLTREKALERIESQMPIEEKFERCDAAVRTDRPIEHTQQELGKLYAERVKLLAKLGAQGDE